jgi:tetratricopeptide (TPR) repeat protein
MWIQRAMLGAALALLGSACMSGYDTRIPPSQSPYDAVAPAQLAVLAKSRAQLLRGEWAQARASLEQAHRSEPGSIPLGIWLQEAQLAEQGLSGEAGGPISDPLRTARLDELTREWRRAAEAQPTAASYVLAARLERDPQTARVLLDRAESLDSRCPWVPYARAFLCARERDWAQVAKQLQNALELEPGHLQSRWLQAWTLARGGDPKEARARLRAWLDHTAEDPRIEARLRGDAELDLALLELLGDDPAAATRSLARLEGGSMSEEARIFCARASAAQARGDLAAALRLAEEASRRDPQALLPLIQQAILQQRHTKDLERAYALWSQVDERSGTSRDFSAVLEQLRARVEQERLERAVRSRP